MVTVTVVAAVALLLAGYGAAGSYVSLWHLAAAHKVPLPRLNPAGLDGGLIGVIVLDITLTWARHPLAWLRFAARMFALGTLAANAAAGWPDPVGVGLRIFAPALIVVITEAVRAVLLDRAQDDRDPIPLIRWFLAPRSTARLWRRMKLWRITSYRAAVDMELSRLQAIEKLTACYSGNGPRLDWRRHAPADLVWMLRNGVKMDEALARVAELTAPAKAEAPGGGARKRKPASGRNRNRKPAVVSGRPETGASALPEPDTADLSTEAQALGILEREPGISGSELGRRLGKSDGYGRALLRQLAGKVAEAEAMVQE